MTRSIGLRGIELGCCEHCKPRFFGTSRRSPACARRPEQHCRTGRLRFARLRAATAGPFWPSASRCDCLWLGFLLDTRFLFLVGDRRPCFRACALHNPLHHASVLCLVTLPSPWHCGQTRSWKALLPGGASCLGSQLLVALDAMSTIKKRWFGQGMLRKPRRRSRASRCRAQDGIACHSCWKDQANV